MNEEKYTYSSCLDWCQIGLSQYGDVKVEMWSERDLGSKSYEDLKDFGGVFIGGGNTFHLLNEFKSSGFGVKLLKLLKETETPVIGGSAGALIFSESIDTATQYDSNDVDLKDLSGYKLTNGYHLWVHYDASSKDIINESTSKLSSQIIAIPENSGIIITNNSIEVVGEGDVVLFPEEKVFSKGSILD